MMKKMTVEQVQTGESFYRLPKSLFTLDYYKNLSLEAKCLYAMLKDRSELSLKNNWIDSEGYVYFIFTIDELKELTGYGKNKIVNLKKKLAEYHLLEEVRQGLNKANRLYLGNIEYKAQTSTESRKFENETSEKADKQRKFKNQTSRSFKSKLQEVSKSNSNDTESSDTEFNKTESYSSRKADPNSHEFVPPAETNDQSSETSSSFLPSDHYALLHVIADRYNNRLFGFPDVLTLTHKQKMQIGQYLSSGFVFSQEILNLIDRIPEACESPLAYLLKSLDNLQTERRFEMKLKAHYKAKQHYGNVG